MINITDTAGIATPNQIREIYSSLVSFIPNIDSIELSLHAHDNKGQAVENALAAIESGFTQIEGTINGVGPAGGNTNLVQLAEALNSALSTANQTGLVSADLKALKSLGSLPSIVNSQSRSENLIA